MKGISLLRNLLETICLAFSVYWVLLGIKRDDMQEKIYCLLWAIILILLGLNV